MTEPQVIELQGSARPDADSLVNARQFIVSRDSRNLYFTEVAKSSSLASIRKAQTDSGASSNQGESDFEIPHPLDFEKLDDLQDISPHHSICMQTKADATVGLGFARPEDLRQRRESVVDPLPNTAFSRANLVYRPSRIDEVLDPMCVVSFSDVLFDVCHDFFNSHNGYMEVVRDESGSIVGLFHLAPKDVFVVMEGDGRNFHYRIKNDRGGLTSGAVGYVDWPRFGDKEDFFRRADSGEGNAFANIPEGDDPTKVSEVIHFRRPSPRCRWYGYPDWLAATPSIELIQALQQYRFDFFNNRGVPEFMLFVTGATVGQRDWAKIESAVRANIGYGNSHQSLALNIGTPGVQIQLEKLAMDTSNLDNFSQMKESLNLDVVTAHRVPPLLAGILIPGKLGALNELPNSLLSFQVLVLSPAQRTFTQTLKRTLGGMNGVEGLGNETWEFRQVTDLIDPVSMDTVSRMRQTLPEAQGEGRDLQQGVRD